MNIVNVWIKVELRTGHESIDPETFFVKVVALIVFSVIYLL